MSKLISIDTNLTLELDRIRRDAGVSYSDAIREYGKNNKDFTDRLHENFMPLKNVCMEISWEMNHPLEVFRIILIKLAQSDNPKRDIQILSAILTEYMEAMKC